MLRTRQAMHMISLLGFVLIMLCFSVSGAVEEQQAAERGDQRQPPAAPKWGDKAKLSSGRSRRGEARV